MSKKGTFDIEVKIAITGEIFQVSEILPDVSIGDIINGICEYHNLNLDSGKSWSLLKGSMVLHKEDKISDFIENDTSTFLLMAKIEGA